ATATRLPPNASPEIGPTVPLTDPFSLPVVRSHWRTVPSAPAVRSESGERANDTPVTAAVCPRRQTGLGPFGSNDQTQTVRSALPAATRLPSGETATHR